MLNKDSNNNNNNNNDKNKNNNKNNIKKTFFEYSVDVLPFEFKFKT